MTPRVTVLTATYNQAAFVRTCLESVLAQTMADWEMIVVDDGSDDGTPDLVRACRDPRVRVLGLDHAGIGRLSDRYNQALERAAGPLVAVLEGDDWWPREKLAAQVPRLEREGAVRRPQLGLATQTLTPALADAFQLPRAEGALVVRVSAGSAAQRGGLMPGDVVIAANDVADFHF